MSRPVIPGYLEQPGEGSLAGLWMRPAGVPAPLWPVQVLRAVHNNPTDWVTVAEHHATDTERSGTSCVLVQAADTSSALAGTGWLGSHLGQVEIVDGEKFEDGLADSDRGVPVEFFAQVRRPSGATAPVPEISHPFLWYWDAFPVRDGWQYLDGAGRVQDLVRQEVQADRWKIEVRALEFRQYLAARGRHGLFQVDHVPWADLEEFPRVDDEVSNDWAHFSFCAVHESSPLGGKAGVLAAAGQVPCPRSQEQPGPPVRGMGPGPRVPGVHLRHRTGNRAAAVAHLRPGAARLVLRQGRHAAALPDSRLLQARGPAALRRRARQVRPVGDAAVVPGPVGRRHLLQQRRPGRGVPRRSLAASCPRRNGATGSPTTSRPRGRWTRAGSAATS